MILVKDPQKLLHALENEYMITLLGVCPVTRLGFRFYGWLIKPTPPRGAEIGRKYRPTQFLTALHVVSERRYLITVLFNWDTVDPTGTCNFADGG